MKIYKLSIFLIFSTLFALLYVHQQVHIVKMSYKIQLSEKRFTSLLDQNKSLRYNIIKVTSPVYIEKKFLADRKEFGIPQQWQVIEVAMSRGQKEPTIVAKAQSNTFGIFNIFGRPKEALANPIK